MNNELRCELCDRTGAHRVRTVTELHTLCPDCTARIRDLIDQFLTADNDDCKNREVNTR